MRIKVDLAGAVGAVIALFFGLISWTAMLFGRIQVKGYGQAYKTVRKGKVLIILNHPSLVETIIMPSFFWFWGLTRLEKKIPWTVADDKLFGGSIRFYPAFRCIPVSREDLRKYPTLRDIRRRLQEGGNIYLYPESGRTCKGESLLSLEGRQVRECVTTPVRLAANLEVLLLPVWVDNPNADKPRSLFHDYIRIWSGKKVTITFGSPIRPDKNMDAKSVAELLLDCGREKT